MENQTGSILTKIAGIINLVMAGLIFIFGIAALIGMSLYKGVPYNAFFVFSAIILIVFAIGYLLLHFSSEMKDPKKIKNASIWTIVLGALTIGNLTGILALIGGIIGLVDSGKRK